MITAKITRITASEIRTLVSFLSIAFLLFLDVRQRLGPHEAAGWRQPLDVQGEQR